jgi:ATP-dependent DNA helicase PIF1
VKSLSGFGAHEGIAAVNVGGSTIHSFAGKSPYYSIAHLSERANARNKGIGLGKETAEILFFKIRKNKRSMERWQNTEVLIIDEISMVDGALFDKLEQLARKLRHSDKPFGGLQVMSFKQVWQCVHSLFS